MATRSKQERPSAAHIILKALDVVADAHKAGMAAGLCGPLAVGPYLSTEQTSDELKALRQRLRLTQSEFAQMYGFDIEALRNWEQQKRLPDTAARTLLRMISVAPAEVATLKRAADRAENTIPA